MAPELNNASQRFVENLASKLRRRYVFPLTNDKDSLHGYCRQVVGSRQSALETVLVLRQVVSKARFSNFEQLVEIIRSVGRRLVEAQPKGECQSVSALVSSDLPTM